MNSTTQPLAAPHTPDLTPPATAIVFPPDTRTQVMDTTVYPYLCIGQLTMGFRNGSVHTGTGTLIDEYHVLTCAHNLFSPDDGGNATSVAFAPGRNGAASPYGSIAAATWYVPAEYASLSPGSPWDGVVADYTDYLYDFAVVRLRNAAPVEPAAGFPAPYWIDGTGLDGVPCTITGYPGDMPADTMWTANGPVSTDDVDTEQFLFYRISTYDGQSGSALMVNHPRFPAPAIVGVHVAGSSRLDTNFAVRLNSSVIDQINGWLSGG